MEVSVSYTFPRGGERVLDAFREGGERVLERRRRGRRLGRRAALDLSHHPPRPPHGRGPQVLLDRLGVAGRAAAATPGTPGGRGRPRVRLEKAGHAGRDRRVDGVSELRGGGGGGRGSRRP